MHDNLILITSRPLTFVEVNNNIEVDREECFDADLIYITIKENELIFPTENPNPIKSNKKNK